MFLLTGIGWLILAWIALRFAPASIPTAGALLNYCEVGTTAGNLPAGVQNPTCEILSLPFNLCFRSCP